MPLGGQYLHIFDPGLAQPIRHPLGGLLHIFGVVGQGRNTGNAQKGQQFLQISILILL